MVIFPSLCELDFVDPIGHPSTLVYIDHRWPCLLDIWDYISWTILQTRLVLKIVVKFHVIYPFSNISRSTDIAYEHEVSFWWVYVWGQICTGSNGKQPGFMCCTKAKWQCPYTFPCELQSFEQCPHMHILVKNHYHALFREGYLLFGKWFISLCSDS